MVFTVVFARFFYKELATCRGELSAIDVRFESTDQREIERECMIVDLIQCTQKSIKVTLIGLAILLGSECKNATAYFNGQISFNSAARRATPTSDTSGDTLDGTLLPESACVGRMLWDPDSNGNDARDWRIAFHITERDGTHFRGRLELGPDGHVPAANLIITGEFKDDQIAFTSDRQKNVQLQFLGKLGEQKPIEMHWQGTDQNNRKRAGTTKIKLKTPGSATN